MPKRLRGKGSSPRRFELRFVLLQLANMPDSGGVRFRGLYSKHPPLYQRYSDRELLKMRDELRLVWEADAEPGKPPDLRLFRSYVEGSHMDSLQQGIAEGPREAPVQKVICDMWLRRERQPVAVIWTKQARKIMPVDECLPAVLAWSCVHYAGNLKICQNPDCETPYFISKRKDQKYCSGQCAAPAKREAKRRWWRTHRSKFAEEGRRVGGRV